MRRRPRWRRATGATPLHWALFLGGSRGTAAAGASWGNVVSGVGGRAKDHNQMIYCLVAIDAITANDAIANDDGGHDSNCEVPISPAQPVTKRTR